MGLVCGCGVAVVLCYVMWCACTYAGDDTITDPHVNIGHGGEVKTEGDGVDSERREERDGDVGEP